MEPDVADDAKRRLNPRPWDHDFVLMRQMAAAFRTLITRHLGTTGELTVVDYGCGPMPYRPLFGPQAHYLGADLPENKQANLILGESGALPLEDSRCDVVVSSQVLEHVLDVKRYLGECRRVMRPDGLLLLSTHGSWVYHPHPNDVRRWTRWGLRFEIEQCGFDVVDVLACVGPLAYATQLQLLLLRGLLLKLGLLGRILSFPASAFCAALMWLEDRITPSWITADNASVYVVAARKTRFSGAGRPRDTASV
jgi:SAM-dependent methyltransferase